MKAAQLKAPQIQNAAAGLGNPTLLLKSLSQLRHLVHAADHDVVRTRPLASRIRIRSIFLPNTGGKSISLASWNLLSRKRKVKTKAPAQRKTSRSFHSDISRRAPRTYHDLSYLRSGTPSTDHPSMQLGLFSPTPSDRSCCACRIPAGDESMHQPRSQPCPGEYTPSLCGGSPSLLPQQGLQDGQLLAATWMSLISNAP